MLRAGGPGDISLFDTSPVSESHKQLSITQQMGEGVPASTADPHQLPALSPAPPLALGLAPVSQGLQVGLGDILVN